MNVTRGAVLTGAVVIFAACESPAGLELVREVSVRQESLTLDLGETLKVEAQAFDTRGRELPVTRIHWASNDPRVVQVSPSGLATAVGAGTTTITAEAGGRVRHVSVEVTVTFEALAAGLAHTCGLTVGGHAACWGSNDWGELGDASLTASGRPVLVRDGGAFRGLSAGGTHTCGVTEDGAVLCWGANWSGQLGSGTADFGLHLVAERLSGSLVFREVDAGDRHVCGVASDSTVFCWGGGFSGQLGVGQPPGQCPGVEEPCSPSPAPVAGVLSFERVVTGEEHSCALTPEGAAYCWGWNVAGQLGDGTFQDRATPTAVLGGHTFSQIAGGAEHTCALTPAGEAYCWGNDRGGRLGTGGTGDSAIPVAVTGGYRFVTLSAGRAHTCGIVDDGTLHCWGPNDYGQLGTGSRESASEPVAAAGGFRWRSVTAGGFHTCGVSELGTAYCWGANLDGQLGTGFGQVLTTPTQVLGQRTPQ